MLRGYIMKDKKTVLLGITGGIAAYKMADVASALVKSGCNVRVIMTTQVFCGGCDLTVYEVGRVALSAGVIPAADMTTEYAVMRAMWALAYSYTAEDFMQLFTDERR